ncbi:MAG TPA: hypothetical protein PKA98_21910, partial [Acidimicrobiales bacterium]|nr:hypothetical protein [Acidimicrobiales bacterium]
NLLRVGPLPVVVVGFAVGALRGRGLRPRAGPLPRRWLPAFAVVVALFWALRLLPWAPFTWLASGV